ncbi:aldehyde dehydrogenase family protein [Caballeronia grimmiae]|uniref:aldehyde dehydrogenase family protein n=1 Tax=Caballeronia grimmiae TaxID=1071679 RepID=UPI0038B8E5B2
MEQAKSAARLSTRAPRATMHGTQKGVTSMTHPAFTRLGIPQDTLFIGGKWTGSDSGETVEVRNPKDETVVATVCQGTASDAEAAIAAARTAFPGWSRQSAIARAGLLQRFAALIDEHAATLAELLVSEQGKPLNEANIEVGFTSLLLRHAAESARWIEGEILPGDAAHEQIWIQRVPYGVVAAMTAWNFPAALFARKVGPALVAGNTIVVKPHELTPLSSLYLAALGARAGIPDGVLNVVLGAGREVGAQLVMHEQTDLISLTGSVRAGGEIYAAAAPRLKPLRLELGGKAPFIVMDDANIDVAVSAAIASKFFAGGSVCTSNDRMYIHARVYEEFIEKFLSAVKALRVGDPMTDVNIGPRISKGEVEKLRQISAKALDQGATKLWEHEGGAEIFSRGNWFMPTIFSVPSNDLRIMKDETFGPMVAAMKVSDFEEALSYANESNYGLSAYVFTESNARIMRCTGELNFGEIYINRPGGESVHGFHTGYKMSGLGGEDGKHGIEGFMRKKTMYNRFG